MELCGSMPHTIRVFGPFSSPLSRVTQAKCCPYILHHFVGCPNDGPFLDPYSITALKISGTQKGTNRACRPPI